MPEICARSVLEMPDIDGEVLCCREYRRETATAGHNVPRVEDIGPVIDARVWELLQKALAALVQRRCAGGAADRDEATDMHVFRRDEAFRS